MKRIFVLLTSAALLLTTGLKCSAAGIPEFDEEVHRIEDSIGGESAEGLEQMEISGVDDVIANGVDGEALMRYLIGLTGENARAPLSALVILIAVLLIVSVAEAYTVSLRYTDTKDIMSMTVSLFCASIVFAPVTQIVGASVTVIQGASSIMSVYLPVIAGIMIFSGRAISSGAYYAAVTAACKAVAYLASEVLEPLLHIVLSLSVCAGIGSHIRLGGLIETVGKGFKYAATFSMSLFAAILGLNGVLSLSADSIADKAAKFSLSSFIPLIGSSIAEAYGAIRSSVGILRSGIGVFVILAVFASFAPVMIQTILWSLTLFAAKTAGEALGVNAAIPVLNALAQFIAALRTVLIAVNAVFIIASGIMISLGGSL